MVKINMMNGSRDWWKEGWIGIDNNCQWNRSDDSDIYLKKQFPKSVDLLYCSHAIAYFGSEEIEELLRAWHHKMRAGGILRIATPDFDVLTDLYKNGVEYDRIKGPLYGKMLGSKNDEYIYHKTCYTEQSLTSLLQSCGFINIHRYDHRKTEHPNTGNREDFYDDHSAAYIDGVLISLNVECQKPL